MKAKVIGTGEIVEVYPLPTWYKEHGQGPDRREWDEDDLEFIYEKKPMLSAAERGIIDEIKLVLKNAAETYMNDYTRELEFLNKIREL